MIKKEEPPWPERLAGSLMKRDAALKNDLSASVPVPSLQDFLRERPAGSTEEHVGLLFPKEQWCCNKATD